MKFQQSLYHYMDTAGSVSECEVRRSVHVVVC